VTITPEDNATSWRDLADQLTPELVERYERLDRGTQGRASAELLEFARQAVEGRLADMAYCDVAPPAGADSVDKWQTHRQWGWSRSVVWREFRGPDVSVDIDGWQRCDGTVAQQGISVYLSECQQFTSGGARRLAELLTEAADEMDRLR
jgi:hypothetical protein